MSAGKAAWVVSPDGVERRLGAYVGASWSPRGLFVVAWRGREMTALERDGVRWWLHAGRSIHAARWAPGDGYRIAYVAGTSLRIVNGDGSGDRRLDRTLPGPAPAWRPVTPGAPDTHALAYVARGRRVRVADIDTDRTAFRPRRSVGSRCSPGPRAATGCSSAGPLPTNGSSSRLGSPTRRAALPAR